MAEAKYLAALPLLRDTRVITPARYAKSIEQAVERLRATNVSTEPGKASWGLNFAYKNTAPEQPFLITTSLVVQGLMDNDGDAARDLAAQGLKWLQTYPFRASASEAGNAVSLPTYSSHTPVVIANALAVWAAVLIDAERRGWIPPDVSAHAAIEQILAWYRPPVGWTYHAGSTRLDLLHTCYVLNSLLTVLPTERVEPLALGPLALFRRGRHLLDKMDVMDLHGALAAAERSGRVELLPIGPSWIVRHDAEALGWSCGEALVLLARLARQGAWAPYWRRLALVASHRVLSKCAARWPEMGFPRDAMHVLHGLSSLWSKQPASDARQAGQ